MRLCVCTNGVNLRPALYSFLKTNNVTIILSLDGPPEVHDTYRKVRATGKGSFAAIRRNIERIPYPERAEIRVHSVLHPDERGALLERLLYMRRLGFVHFNFFPMCQWQEWKSSNLALLGRQFRRFTDEYCSIFLCGNRKDAFVISPLQDYLLAGVTDKKGKKCVQHKWEDCNSLWLEPQGGFTVCERVAGIQPKCESAGIGDVRSGIDHARRDALLADAGKCCRKAVAGQKMLPQDCFLCAFSFYFQGKVNGVDHLADALRFYCRVQKYYAAMVSTVLKKVSGNRLFMETYGIGQERIGLRRRDGT